MGAVPGQGVAEGDVMGPAGAGARLWVVPVEDPHPHPVMEHKLPGSLAGSGEVSQVRRECRQHGRQRAH